MTTPEQTAAAPQGAVSAVNIVPGAAEELGRVPNHFVWLRPGLQMMQDPVDAQLVFVDDEGRVVGRSTLPPPFRIGDIVLETDQVRLIDVSGKEQVIVPRDIDAGAVTSFQASALNGVSKQGSRVLRTGPRQLQLQLNGAERSAGVAQLNIRSITGGTLAQAYEIGLPSGGYRYVVSEEVAGITPGLRVRVFAQRFDRTGRVTGIAHLSLDDMDVVPRDFVTVTDDGVLRVLVPTASGVMIREIQFSEPGSVDFSRNGKLTDDDLRALGEVGREIPVDSNVAKSSDRSERRQDETRFALRVATPPIARERALANARAYLTINWVMKHQNFSNTRIENRCDPAQAKFWLRPAKFTSSTIGQTIGPMPYRWGGDDTPESFALRVEWGALAGDICTCRNPNLDYCLVPESAGVDCSGFVSKAWGISKRGTWGLLDVATELSNIAELRPADAFVRPGSHVRLLVGWGTGSAIEYTVLESSTRRDCEGVCERTYRPSELNGYRLIRYRGIVN